MFSEWRLYDIYIYIYIYINVCMYVYSLSVFIILIAAMGYLLVDSSTTLHSLQIFGFIQRDYLGLQCPQCSMRKLNLTSRCRNDLLPHVLFRSVRQGVVALLVCCCLMLEILVGRYCCLILCFLLPIGCHHLCFLSKC